MRYLALLATAAFLALPACGSNGGDTPEADSGDDAPPMEQAGANVGTRAEGLVISARTYTAGGVKARVTGFFEVDGSQELNKPASITDEDQTWIQYGVSGAAELNVLFTNSTAMAENGINVSVGPYTVTATSTSGECRTTFDVTPAAVKGHYSCKGSTGHNNKTGAMGKVDIEVDFNAES
jgi:hypothetical protein